MAKTLLNQNIKDVIYTTQGAGKKYGQIDGILFILDEENSSILNAADFKKSICKLFSHEEIKNQILNANIKINIEFRQNVLIED